jgi:hypothetical protein
VERKVNWKKHMDIKVNKRAREEIAEIESDSGDRE